MVRSVKLNSGSSLPILGMGTVALSESQQQVKDTLLTAIEVGAAAADADAQAALCYSQVGYRHFDTAMLYGTEAARRDALVEAFSTGLVKREEIFVTTKLWITDNHCCCSACSSNQSLIREYWKNKAIQVTAYSPLTSPAPGAEVYFNQRISVLKDPIILAIAEQHAKSPAQKISTIPQAQGTCGEFMVNEGTGPYCTLQELWDDEGDRVAS
ncbi:unnamed protein product [Sphagnum troendelagicum]|uniref:NADP-dependent oxidoreductase domain-containing protein n=1 Tax=Sphagnum troendelagicum TaxID=128251 RepID=A0ABP0TY96_9BRYO